MNFFIKNKKVLLIIGACLAIIVSIHNLWHAEPHRHPASSISDSISDKVFDDNNEILVLVENIEDNKTFAWLKTLSVATGQEKAEEEVTLKKIMFALANISKNKDAITTPKDIEDIFIDNGYEPVLVTTGNLPDIARKGKRLKNTMLPFAGLGLGGGIAIAVISIASLPVSVPIAAIVGGATVVGIGGATLIGLFASKEFNSQYGLDYTIGQLIHDALEDWRQQEGIEQLDFVSMFNPRTINLEVE